MRKLAVLAAVAALLAIPMARAATQPTTTLKTSTLQVGFGHTVMLAGTVSTHAAGVPVHILARPFDKAALGEIAIVHTLRGGQWHYVATPRIATTYAAAVGSAQSPSLMVAVRPGIALTLSPTGDVIAQVSGIPTFRGRFVQLQNSASGAWHTIAKQRLDAHSRTVFAATLIHAGASHLRVAMSVNEAGKGYLGGFSAPIDYPAHAVSLATSGFAVTYGGSVLLRGRVSAGKPNAVVRIFARPFVRTGFEPVATVHTTTAGRFTYKVTPPFQTSFLARFANGTSRALTIGVAPKMTANLLAGDRVWAHVGLAKNVTGKAVEMQQRQANGTWKTVATMPLNAKATAIFQPAALPAGTSTLRTAISVNKVGAGFLAGFSAPFTYHR